MLRERGPDEQFGLYPWGWVCGERAGGLVMEENEKAQESHICHWSVDAHASSLTASMVFTDHH